MVLCTAFWYNWTLMDNTHRICIFIKFVAVLSLKNLLLINSFITHVRYQFWCNVFHFWDYWTMIIVELSFFCLMSCFEGLMAWRRTSNLFSNRSNFYKLMQSILYFLQEKYLSKFHLRNCKKWNSGNKDGFLMHLAARKNVVMPAKKNVEFEEIQVNSVDCIMQRVIS